MRRTSRDPEVVRQGLQRWLGEVTGADGGGVEVDDLRGTDANGMSSDTLLCRARWEAAGSSYDERLVVRMAPGAADVPVFPQYDMAGQFSTLRAVRDHSDVPVPDALWCDADGRALGAPLFAMREVDGVVPPDVMPYTFGGNWLADASPAEQQRLQDTTVDALSALHAISADAVPFLTGAGAPDPLAAHLARTREWYAMVVAAGGRAPLVDALLDRLDAHRPEQRAAPVLSWGDARIGNVLYDGFRPAALLDWEMAAVGPRELDVAWLVYAHTVFQDLAESLGLPGMPSFLRVGDVAGRYAALTGHEPRHLEWFAAYAAVQWAVVFLRTGQRQAHFGERDLPPDPQDLILNKAHLEAALAGEALCR